MSTTLLVSSTSVVAFLCRSPNHHTPNIHAMRKAARNQSVPLISPSEPSAVSGTSRPAAAMQML